MSAPRFLHRGIYPILDRDACLARGLAPQEVVEHWLRLGASLIQLRAKGLTTREWVGWANPLVAAIRAAGATAIINDRPDIARLTGAHGVHLGQEEMLVGDARRVLGSEAIVGLSTHNLAEIRQAMLMAPDYIGFGPIHETGSKQNTAPTQGLAALREACRATTLPVVAIGGITWERLKETLECGAQAAAVIGALLDDPRMAQALRRQTW